MWGKARLLTHHRGSPYSMGAHVWPLTPIPLHTCDMSVIHLAIIDRCHLHHRIG